MLQKNLYSKSLSETSLSSACNEEVEVGVLDISSKVLLLRSFIQYVYVASWDIVVTSGTFAHEPVHGHSKHSTYAKSLTWTHLNSFYMSHDKNSKTAKVDGRAAVESHVATARTSNFSSAARTVKHRSERFVECRKFGCFYSRWSIAMFIFP